MLSELQLYDTALRADQLAALHDQQRISFQLPCAGPEYEALLQELGSTAAGHRRTGTVENGLNPDHGLRGVQLATCLVLDMPGAFYTPMRLPVDASVQGQQADAAAYAAEGFRQLEDCEADISVALGQLDYASAHNASAAYTLAEYLLFPGRRDCDEKPSLLAAFESVSPSVLLHTATDASSLVLSHESQKAGHVLGLFRSPELARQRFRYAASLGDPEALHRWGVLVGAGIGRNGAQDLRVGYCQGDAGECLHRENWLLTSSITQLEDAVAVGIAHFAAMADADEAWALLGTRYRLGNGVAADTLAAGHYLHHAAVLANELFHTPGRQPWYEMDRLSDDTIDTVEIAQRVRERTPGRSAEVFSAEQTLSWPCKCEGCVEEGEG